MGPRRAAMRGLGYSAAVLFATRAAPGARAQDACVDVTVSGLVDDGFPASDTVYSNTLADEEDLYGEYVNEGNDYFIWYSPTDPTDWTSDEPAAGIDNCLGVWVLSSYPPGESFTDTVWYQAAGIEDGLQCETSPTDMPDDWIRVTSDASESVTLDVACATEDDSDDGDGLSKRTVVVLLIVVGVGFMVLMCLGALACCIHKGRQGPEENIMPPGELPEEGSVIGGKAGDSTKPGLHAHPEVRGAQHPRPEDWAPSYNSSRNGAIPTGSRSGPSVRSIGYT